MDVAQRATILAKTGAIGVGVRGALSSGTGEKLADIVKGETLSGGLALGQSVVGDIALEKGFKTGSAEKVAMHTLTGTAYSALTCANPFIANSLNFSLIYKPATIR